MKPSSSSGKSNAMKRAAMTGMTFDEEEEDASLGMMLNRKALLDDEDLEQQSKFFEQQKTPSASVAKKSKFAMEREQRKAKAEATSEEVKPTSSNAGLLGIFANLNIVERDATKKPILPPSMSSQNQAFPTLKQPSLTHLGRKPTERTRPQPGGSSVQEQITEKKPVEEPVKEVTNVKESEEETIDKESEKMLKQMSAKDINEAKEELFKQLDPSIINMLKNRGLQKKDKKQQSSVIKPTEVKAVTKDISSEEKREIIEKDIGDIIQKIKQSLNPSELENISEEEQKLKWMVGGDELEETEEEKNDKSKWKKIRFDLQGNVIDETKEYAAHSGLYHHGREQDKAGYTLLEIFQLIRSSVITQRIINIKLLTHIIEKIGKESASDLIIYLQQRYDLWKVMFWFGYSDPLSGSSAVIAKNLNLIKATTELIREVLSVCYTQQQSIFDNIEKHSFDYGMVDVNNTVTDKLDLLVAFEKDVSSLFVSHLVSILETEDDEILKGQLLDCLIIIAQHSLTWSFKVWNEMSKRSTFSPFNTALAISNADLAIKYATLCTSIARHGTNICQQVIKQTSITDICKKHLISIGSLNMSNKISASQFSLGKELLSFVTCCVSYKLEKIMSLFCEEMFSVLAVIVQFAFHKNGVHEDSVIELSKACLHLLQVYMTSKSALSFPSFEDKDEVDENSIGHLENFALQDCPLLAVKALNEGQDSLCIRFLYFVCAFYDNFYCNPNSDFSRFVNHDSVDTTSQLMRVMKCIENRSLYQELYKWAENSINSLESTVSSNENVEVITQLLANLTSVVTLVYFCSKSFKHMFGILFDELHFEHILCRLYDAVFKKFLFNKAIFTFASQSTNPLRCKFFMLRQRFFNLTHYILRLYTYEKTKIRSILTKDQITNIALFSATLLEPFKIRGDRESFFNILQTYVLEFNPTFLEYLNKEVYTFEKDSKEEVVESNNLQVGAPVLAKEHADEIPVTSTNWIYKALEYYYTVRLDEVKDVGLILDNLKFITSITFGFDYKKPMDEQAALNNDRFIDVFFPKVMQYANMMKVFLIDTELFFNDSIQAVLQAWIDRYDEQEYYRQKEFKKSTARNPFEGIPNMAATEDIFFQMYQNFIEHHISSSFNQSTFAQYVVSFLMHTHIWPSKYRAHIVDEMTLKQISSLRMNSNNDEWVERLSVFPAEDNPTIVATCLKKFLSILPLETIQQSFIFRYMIHHVVHSLPELSTEWKVEHREVISSLFEAIQNPQVLDYILSKMVTRYNVADKDTLIKKLKENRILFE